MTRLVVNGDPCDLAADPDTSLLWAVRDELGLRGTKYSCLEGVCGSCTLLVDDQPVRSCVTSLGSVAGRAVTTIEGLADNDRLHPVQQGFLEELGFQCGYCTAGQIATAVGLLRRDPAPDDDEIREAMSDNVCRCCAYPRILRAVRRASELTRSGNPGRTRTRTRTRSRGRRGRAAGRAACRIPAASRPALGSRRRAAARMLRGPRRRPRCDSASGRGGCGLGGDRRSLGRKWRRVAARRRNRRRHGLQRKGRLRPGQQHCAVDDRRRRAPRSPNGCPTRHGRHGRLPVRHGHVRQSLDA